MAIKNSKGAKFTGPCAGCSFTADCVPFQELSEHLFSHAKFQNPPVLSAMDIALDHVVEKFLTSLRTLKSQGLLESARFGNAFSALVDYCITGIYTNGLINDKAEFTQEALQCGTEAVFPYTWMCPICVAAGAPRGACYLPLSRREVKGKQIRDYPKVEMLAKPGGRAIGDQGIQAVKALLRATLIASGTNARLRDGGGARGEFDLTIATDDTLAFIEVKAKPLIAYPLVAELMPVTQPLSASSLPRHDGPELSVSETRIAYQSIAELASITSPSPKQLISKPLIPKHTWRRVSVADTHQLSLLLGASNERLKLSHPTVETVSTWPLEDLAALAGDPATVVKLIGNWTEHANAYAEWKNEPDRLRWHRFGCGNFAEQENGERVEKRVANTKELPGLDRTDDIKKGAAQVLRYSRLKFQCKKRALRSVLLGNTHALTHQEDYVAPLLHLKVVDRNETDLSKAEWIFDAMIGLTQNHFNAPELEDIFAFDRLLDELPTKSVDTDQQT